MTDRNKVLDAVTAVAFDIGGTLLDHAGATRDALREILGDRFDNDQELEAFGEVITSRIDARMDRIAEGKEPFAIETQIRLDVLKQALTERRFQLSGGQLSRLASVGERFRPYPGVPAQLGRLAESVAVIGLTNTGFAQMVRACTPAQMRWTALLSTQLASTYKPSPRAYALIPDLLGIAPAETLFVAAHPWDLRAAAAEGFHTAYLPRPDAGRPQSDDKFDVVLDSLDELADLLKSRR